MRYIALTGMAGTGKTTVSRTMYESYGYMWINFSDRLKKLYCSHHPGVTVEDIHNNKAQYRTALQEFGDNIGYNEDPSYTYSALREWNANGKPPAIFDNARYPAQAAVLRAVGFSVVCLQVHDLERLARGVVLTNEQQNHLSEAPLESDFTLDTTHHSPDFLARHLMALVPCNRCRGPMWNEGEERRGLHKRVLCRKCWVRLLQTYEYEKIPLIDLAQAYGVSVAAISQKRKYLSEIRKGM